MTSARFLKSFTKTGVAARDIFQRKFTLAVETLWGDVTLPAGDYHS
jgi:hypothetical protein